jgi:sugar lactone lactonase YvrE
MRIRLNAVSIFICSLAMMIPQQVFAQQPIALNQPNGLVFDRQGNLYVANAGSNQVLVYNAQLVQQTSLTIGKGLSEPVRLAFDPFGNLYVANFNINSLTVYDQNHQQLVGRTITQHVDRPLGVVVDAYGDVFVANNATETVTVYNVDGILLGTLRRDVDGRHFSAPGALAIGGTDLFVGTGPTSGPNYVTAYNVGEFLTLNPREMGTIGRQISGPTGVAFDRLGNVYVSDFYSGTATKYDAGGTLLLTIHDGTQNCEGIALDRRGNIYVSNEFLNTITVYDPSGKLINTIH